MSVNVKVVILRELEFALRNVEMGLDGARELAREQLKSCARRVWEIYEETEPSPEHYALLVTHDVISYKLLPITRSFRQFGTKKRARRAAISAVAIPIYLAKRLPDKGEEPTEIDNALNKLMRYWEGDQNAFGE